MDLSTLLGLLHIDPLFIPVNAGLVVVLVAWLRAPIEQVLPLANPNASLNSFWLQAANLVCQMVMLLIEFVAFGGNPTIQAAAILLLSALLSAFGAAFGYGQVINAKATSNTLAANTASTVGDTPMPAPTPTSTPATGAISAVAPAVAVAGNAI